MKQMLGIYSAPDGHWVGNGFPVRSLFSYGDHGQSMSPFLLLDYAGPAEFEPDTSGRKRGVGQHPHRGFETVTIVYQGEVDHRDSTGVAGHIGPGDVQWMTAAAGILHDEFHSDAFTRRGGTLEMVQLWVNLPAKDKLAAPGYQTLLKADIPSVDLQNNAGTVRVIAGKYQDTRGLAHTFSPVNVWDVSLMVGHTALFDIPAGHTVAVVVLHGTILLNAEHQLNEAQFALLGREGIRFLLEATGDAILLILSGQSLDEPIVGRGPFVMNTQAEIDQAIRDFNSGLFGSMPG